MAAYVVLKVLSVILTTRLTECAHCLDHIHRFDREAAWSDKALYAASLVLMAAAHAVYRTGPHVCVWWLLGGGWPGVAGERGA